MESGRRDDKGRERVSKLVDVIPPASALKEAGKALREKRIRIKHDPSVKPDSAKLNSDLAKMLNISDRIELVVAGRAKFVLNAIIDDSVEHDRVHVNPDVMKSEGVADNSIATVRAYSGTLQAGAKTRI
ncbi:MAG: hypothetical protein ACO2O2_04815 [Acidilobaceae archaeon]